MHFKSYLSKFRRQYELLYCLLAKIRAFLRNWSVLRRHFRKGSVQCVYISSVHTITSYKVKMDSMLQTGATYSVRMTDWNFLCNPYLSLHLHAALLPSPPSSKSLFYLIIISLLNHAAHQKVFSCWSRVRARVLCSRESAVMRVLCSSESAVVRVLCSSAWCAASVQILSLNWAKQLLRAASFNWGQTAAAGLGHLGKLCKPYTSELPQFAWNSCLICCVYLTGLHYMFWKWDNYAQVRI